ncbi:hypothetical protein SNEBB_006544 [Seison nebaliae]|nr:hypothetical protein SNEBB_006544 [Seison nebaliae]
MAPSGPIAKVDQVVNIHPNHYVHVLDNNLNTIRLIEGPHTLVRRDNEKLLEGPLKMISVPPNHFVVISNPVVKNGFGVVQFDEHNQATLQYEKKEIRFTQPPFPLYPGEKLEEGVEKLKVLKKHEALRIRVVLDTKIGEVNYHAGDEYLFEGPATYIPKIETEIIESITAYVVLKNSALRLKAERACIDRSGVKRVAGEEWLVRKLGAYLPGVDEKYLGHMKAYTITDTKALHLAAIKAFTDVYGKTRKTGDEWLVTSDMSDVHIPDVHEENKGYKLIQTLSSREYCYIENPIDEHGNIQLGKKKLVKGEISFFLQPGENIVGMIQKNNVLANNEALSIRCDEKFTCERGVERKPGELWQLCGPLEYVPPVEVTVIKRSSAIPLTRHQGIYVRNLRSGDVQLIRGQTYMLSPYEELWKKELENDVENLILSEKDPLTHRSERGTSVKKKKRNSYDAIQCAIPHNAAVQIYDRKTKISRVEFGPDQVMLEPTEDFTLLNLSGSVPKRPNVIKAICLLLGPDFCTDIITIETADHARLSLKLSYNWNFDVSDDISAKEAKSLFSVPDFIGDMCKAVASRIRGAVAQTTFDDFHKHSAEIIKKAVFGVEEATDEGEEFVKKNFRFPSNRLLITGVDIQSVEPIDQKTKDSLQKSVQLAIEITTKSQEAAAKNEAMRVEQKARGELERQRLQDLVQAEKENKVLLELQANSAVVERTGAAIAEAQSRAEAEKILGESEIEKARLKANATTIEAEAKLAELKNIREAEIDFQKKKNELKILREKKKAEIQIKKIEKQIGALGQNTIKAIASAENNRKVDMLKALNMRSTLITTGDQPVNLFKFAEGIIEDSNKMKQEQPRIEYSESVDSMSTMS